MSIKAPDLRRGDLYEYRNAGGHLVSSWTATGDASPNEDNPGEVVVPVRYSDGGDGVRVFLRDAVVPASRPINDRYRDYPDRLDEVICGDCSTRATLALIPRDGMGEHDAWHEAHAEVTR